MFLRPAAPRPRIVADIRVFHSSGAHEVQVNLTRHLRSQTLAVGVCECPVPCLTLYIERQGGNRPSAIQIHCRVRLLDCLATGRQGEIGGGVRA